MVFRSKYSKRRTSRRKSKTPFKKAPVKRLVRNYKTKQLVKLIKGVQLKQAETCYRTFKYESFACYHNVITRLHVWYPNNPIGNNLFPTQGNTDGNRHGDEIIAQGCRLRMVMNVPYDRRNSTFKLFFVQWNSTQGDPITRTDFLHDITGNIMLDPIQTDRWPGVKFLGTYYCRGKDLQGTDHHTILINKWIPMKKKITFNSDGDVMPSNVKENGALVILPYSTTGALTTDTIATNCQFSLTLYYKDP